MLATDFVEPGKKQRM